MNTINLKQELLNRDGNVSTAKIPVKTMVDKDGTMVEESTLEEKVVTLGSMLEHACLKQDGDKDLETVVERYELFRKIENKDEVELSDEELLLIKNLVCQSFDIFFAGSILELLN